MEAYRALSGQAAQNPVLCPGVAHFNGKGTASDGNKGLDTCSRCRSIVKQDIWQQTAGLARSGSAMLTCICIFHVHHEGAWCRGCEKDLIQPLV